MNKDKILNHFSDLLDSQIERAENLINNKNSSNVKDQIIIGLVDGDGIGPIILESAKDIIYYLLEDEINSKKVVIKEINGLTIENRTKLGKAVPDDVLEEIKKCDVLLKGPTTTPKGGTLESANVALRRELDLYANIRPVKIPEKNIDWIFFRENTEGEYVLGSKGFDIPGLLAMDFKVITVEGTRRIAKSAFEYAKKNGISVVLDKKATYYVNGIPNITNDIVKILNERYNKVEKK